MGDYLFIVLIPFVLVAGAAVTLFAIGALFDALDNPGDLQRRIEGAFRRPLKPAHPLPTNHYYRPHWG